MSWTSDLSRPCMAGKRPERLGRHVADRDQPVPRQHEADRIDLRMPVLDAVERAQRHVERAVLLVEAARRLDLAHVLAGRDLHADALLDELVLLARRLLEVDPGRVVGDSLALGRIDDAAVAIRSVGSQHRAVDRSNGSALQAASRLLTSARMTRSTPRGRRRHPPLRRDRSLALPDGPAAHLHLRRRSTCGSGR